MSMSLRHIVQQASRTSNTVGFKLNTQGILTRCSTKNIGFRALSTKTHGALAEKVEEEGVMFKDTSKPRPYTHVPPGARRSLPGIPRKWPIITASIILGISFWSLFLFYTTNASKLSSSITLQILRSIRSSPEIQSTLGDAIRFEPKWYLNGSGLVKGHIGVLKGDIDVCFRVRGSKGAGTVYFTSIRMEKGVPFTNLRFKVIADDGTVVHLDPSSM